MVDDENKIIKELYEPYFLLFPDYYKIFKDLLNNVIYKDNDYSFPLKYKLFYGLMASSTIGCEHLLEDFKNKFLILVGDNSWVEQGLKCKDIPENIKGIATINNILAHKPWIMDWRYFAVFKNGLSTFLFESAIILTTIQRYATILNTFKLIIHYDILEADKQLDFLEENENSKEDLEKKEEKQEKSQNDEEKAQNDEEKEEKYNINEIRRKKKKKKSEKIEEEIQKVITSIKNKIEFKENEEERKNNIGNNKEIFKKYIYELIVSYSDFNQHAEKYLYAEDFNWNTNAKYFFIDLAGKDMEYLEKDFNFLNNKIFENEKKTEAIEKYVNLIFGIKDNEYNYHNNNIYLSVEEKRIIKKIACYPDQISEIELSACFSQLNKEQFIHLIFLVAVTKQKISLTFFAKTFEEFRSENE